MNKSVVGFVVLAALVFLASCRPAASTAQPTSTHYWTALEAYEQIRPAMLNWHADAIVVYIGTTSDIYSNQYISTDGRYFEWGFSVQSPSALKGTIIHIANGEITIGVDGIEGREIPLPSPGERLPLNEMIDSNEAIAIALKNGVTTDYVLLDVRIDRFDSITGKYISPSWGLTYVEPSDPSQEYRVLIDIATGEVLRNDFTYTPPPPTLTVEPGADQLLIRAFGEFQLYIINPQGQLLGIAPDSEKVITEVLDARYDPDSDVMTEDAIHLASALIMNPIDGRYRVQLHGPGEPEKRCRLSIEVRKGTEEEVLREVDISCQKGVSVVYEFTLSLSGEQLLSNITPVEE